MSGHKERQPSALPGVNGSAGERGPVGKHGSAAANKPAGGQGPMGRRGPMGGHGPMGMGRPGGESKRFQRHAEKADQLFEAAQDKAACSFDFCCRQHNILHRCSQNNEQGYEQPAGVLYGRYYAEGIVEGAENCC